MFRLKVRGLPRFGELALVGLAGVSSACAAGTQDGDDYGLIELSVVEGEVDQAELPGAEARALLSLGEERDGAVTGTITFIDGGLLAELDPAAWSGPYLLAGTCEGGTCSLQYGDPDAPDADTPGTGDSLALAVEVAVAGTAVTGHLDEVLRTDGVARSRASLTLDGLLVGPASYEPGDFTVRAFPNGDCEGTSSLQPTLHVSFDDSGRGGLTDDAGLLTTPNGPVELPGVASGDHFFAFLSQSVVDGDPSSGTECRDERAWWAELAVDDGELTGTLTFRWARGDGDGQYACSEPPVECATVWVFDPA